MSTRHADAHAALWPSHGLTVLDGDRTPLDLDELFRESNDARGGANAGESNDARGSANGRGGAPKVLEIGFGMGDTLAAMAAADPARDYLGIEVHTPGIGNLLAEIQDHRLSNVRVALGDAMQLVHRLAPGSLDAVHIFFPDPWPKARHHKRRLVQPANIALLRDRLRPGGLLHCATDWPGYAEAMAATLDADPGLEFVDRERAGRPETKFERRGVGAGRPITDLRYRRRTANGS
ncbi:tRNA (guanosine(46)-N7)-methyltransferase TrmB [Actinoplanes sp. M2I2]|uniref:tRNA (guanosine(46)-N7)-methyltransferase TrmB n=1 Tax=Actinoplanes sp. M2I2 TaxID=1734444 RepID=UPI00201FEBE1|nr:tRNA (guanosine(46)-N7)-methyltransferase TrmB [Actinoplanes sp. M2I2]